LLVFSFRNTLRAGTGELLEAVGSAQEQHGGKIAMTIAAQTEYFDPPRHKDIDTQAVVNLRQMLTEAGYRADFAGATAAGQEGNGRTA
jgi:hypothetical protein